MQDDVYIYIYICVYIRPISIARAQDMQDNICIYVYVYMCIYRGICIYVYMYVCCFTSLHVQCNTPRPTLHAQCSTARITMQRTTNMQDCTRKYTSENASSLYRCMHKAKPHPNRMFACFSPLGSCISSYLS
jgi:hypothetical protein